MTYLLWLIKAILFFTLFAFALNNQQDATVHFFFGQQWTAPLVLIVLLAFTIGMVVGILGMVPVWLEKKKKRNTEGNKSVLSTTSEAAPLPPQRNSDMSDIHGV